MNKSIATTFLFLVTTLCNIAIAKVDSKKSLQERFLPKHKSTQASKATSLFTPKREMNYYWNDTASNWTFSDTALYTYDNKAHILSKLQKDQYGVNISLQTNTFSNNGLITTCLTQFWDNTTNTWINSYKRTINYDIHLNTTLDQSEYWDGSTNTWVIVSAYQHAYTYNAQGWPSSITNSMWDATSLTFMVSDRSINITYNAQGSKLTEQMDYFDGSTNTWIPYELDNYTYTNQNILASLIISQPSGTIWEPSYRVSNLVWYQWNGNIDNSLIQSYYMDAYDLSINNWIWDTRCNVTYTTNNSNVSIIEIYNGTSWTNDTKTIKQFDTYDNPTLSENYSWDGFANWLIDNGATYQYQYTGQGAMSEKIIQVYDAFTSMAYLNSTKSVYDDFIEFNWATGINSNNTNDANIFPNPSQDKFTIKLNQASALQIYNMLGELMFSDSKVSQVEVDCSNWPSSTYVIQVQNPNEGSFTKKFVKN